MNKTLKHRLDDVVHRALAPLVHCWRETTWLGKIIFVPIVAVGVLSLILITGVLAVLQWALVKQ